MGPLLRCRCCFDLTHDDGQVRKWLEDSSDAATATRGVTFDNERLADKGLRDDQIVDIEIVVVFSVGDGGLQALLDVARYPLAREFQIGERGRSLLAADQPRHKIELLRTYPQHPGNRLGFVVGECPFVLCLAHRYRLTNLPPAPVPQPPDLTQRYASPCGRKSGRRTPGSARTRRICVPPSLPSPRRVHA